MKKSKIVRLTTVVKPDPTPPTPPAGSSKPVPVIFTEARGRLLAAAA